MRAEPLIENIGVDSLGKVERKNCQRSFEGSKDYPYLLLPLFYPADWYGTEACGHALEMFSQCECEIKLE
jgi:hypothetical protein